MALKAIKLINKEKIKALWRRLQSVPWFLGERVFLLFSIMMGMAVIIGVIIFLRYAILAQRLNPVLLPESAFNKQILQKIVKIRQDREEASEAAGLKDYPDLFLPKGEQNP
jgi:hypothetical protein